MFCFEAPVFTKSSLKAFRCAENCEAKLIINKCDTRAVALSDNGVGDGSMDTGDNDTCLQLALEGEKLCKAGNCRDGVAFFEAALQVSNYKINFLQQIVVQRLRYDNIKGTISASVNLNN